MRLLLSLLISFGFSTFSFAAQIEPATLSYQGTLTNSTGQPLDGTKSIQVCLYKSPTGASGLPAPDPANGSAFWCDNYTVALKNGQFSIVLGRDNNELKGKLGEFNGTTYVGVKVGTDPEMAPRQKLTSVAYALNAQNGVPKGTIVMWNGSTAPLGWALCDGGTHTAQDGTTVTTPNLSDRFILGAGSTFPFGSQTSGSTTKNLSHIHTTAPVSLSVAQLAKHSHSHAHYGEIHSMSSGDGYGRNVVTGNGGTDEGWHGYDIVRIFADATESGADQPHGHGNTGPAGLANQDIMPPYYVLAFIMKL